MIDTPGMRELQLWEASDGIDQTFADIQELAAHCHFRDCQHGTEPGCAVRAAVEADTLDAQLAQNDEALARSSTVANNLMSR